MLLYCEVESQPGRRPWHTSALSKISPSTGASRKEGRRQGPYTCFELYFDVFRTIRMGSPQSSHIEIQHQEFYLGIRIDGDSGLQFTNGSLMPTLEYLEIATPYIQITTTQSCQDPNAESTVAKLAEKSGRVRRSRRTSR
jgi:hypothetical protein